MTADEKRPRIGRRHPVDVVKLTMQLPAELVADVDASADADLRARQHQIAVLLREALDARARRAKRRKPAP